jgi:hypothetical protein
MAAFENILPDFFPILVFLQKCLLLHLVSSSSANSTPSLVVKLCWYQGSFTACCKMLVAEENGLGVLLKELDSVLST